MDKLRDKKGCTARYYYGSLLFIIYINDLLNLLEKNYNGSCAGHTVTICVNEMLKLWDENTLLFTGLLLG